MKNRKLLLVVSLMLALTMSLGGTLAYLTDTDEAVNVMTLGNVEIDQYENGQAENGFTNGQPLYPAYYAGEKEDSWKAASDTTGSIKKVVDVKNVGSSKAYIRTLFAIEIGELTDAEFEKNIHLEWKLAAEPVTKIDIDGAKYQVFVYTYPEAIEAGAMAGETLQRVVMDKYATNEIVKKLGNTYEILVLSQAVQTNNFDTLFADKGAVGVLDEAFGETEEKAAEWFNAVYNKGGLPTTVVATAADLKAAIEKGSNVMVSADIDLEEAIEIPAGVTVVLNLNGKNLSSSDYVFENYGDLTIMGEGQLGGLGGIRSHSGSVTINGGTFTGSSDWNNKTYQHILKAVNTNVVINDGNFDATIKGMTNALINVSENSVVTINGGKFKNVAGELGQFDPYLFTYEKNGKLIINGGDFRGGWRFNGETTTTDIYGGNFEVSYDGQSFHANSTHVLTVYGGTFSNKLGERIAKHVAKGYKASENNGTWTVTAIPTVETAKELRAALKKGGNVMVAGTMNAIDTVDVPTWSNAPAEFVIDATEVNSLSGGEYVLDEASKYGIVARISAGETLALSDMKVTANSQWPMYLSNYGGTLTVTDVEVEAEAGAGVYPYGTAGTTTLKNVKVNQNRLDPAYASSTPWAATAVATSNGHNLIIESGTYVGSSWAVYGYNSGSTITINGGTFKANKVIQLDGVWSGTNKSVATINGGTFDGAIYLDYGNNAPELYINGGSFTNFSATVNGKAVLSISGGTFDADPSVYVADGYTATQNADDTWTVTAE